MFINYLYVNCLCVYVYFKIHFLRAVDARSMNGGGGWGHSICEGVNVYWLRLNRINTRYLDVKSTPCVTGSQARLGSGRDYLLKPLKICYVCLAVGSLRVYDNGKVPFSYALYNARER